MDILTLRALTSTLAPNFGQSALWYYGSTHSRAQVGG